MKKTIIAIGTHPDDIEIGCGGTLSILKDKGHNLIHIIITSGEEGCNFKNKSKIRKIREAEAIIAAKKLKASQVIFFRHSDGLISYSKQTKVRLISIIRKIRPDIIFTHGLSDHFPDHQVVHRLTMQAIIGASGPWYPDAKGNPHQVNEVYGYEVWNPISNFQLAINISSSIDKKLELIRCYKSQTTDIDYVEAIKSLSRYRGVMSMKGQYAEVFEVLKVSNIF